MMEIRRVHLDEINEVMEIIQDAKTLLSKDSLQWQQGYPNINTMKEDIQNGDLFGAYLDSLLVGVVALVKGLNINYTEIYDGAWIMPTSSSDLVIHRIAVRSNYHHLGIGKAFMDFAESYAKECKLTSIKVDTHEKNKIMQALCINNGYKYCGIIYLKRDEVDNSRLAYEKIIN